jgi:hypothetical protein
MLCGFPSQSVIDVDLRHTRQVLRALVRFHFDESAYNGHLGGDSIEGVLLRPNPILDHSNADGVDSLCLDVFDEGYETPALGISLFAGYAEGYQRPSLQALFHADDPFLTSTRRRLEIENYFHLAADLETRLVALRSHIEKDVHQTRFFRARIGVEERAIHYSTGEIANVPYSGKSLLAPPPPAATPGRLNRSGVSFLYVASDVPTAVAEVRPHPGHLVSTGEVRRTHPCKLADFTRVWLANFADSDESLGNFRFLRTIERDFSTPVAPEERTRCHHRPIRVPLSSRSPVTH